MDLETLDVQVIEKKYLMMDESGLPLLGVVPEDENVTLAAAFETPLLKYGRKGAAAACKRIAKRIQGLPVPIDLR